MSVVSSAEGGWQSAAQAHLVVQSASRGEPHGQHTVLGWLTLFPPKEVSVRALLGSSGPETLWWAAAVSGIQDCLRFPLGAPSYSKRETDPDFAQDAPETLPFPSASPVTPWYEPHSWRGPRTNWVSGMESQALFVLVQAWLMHTRP